MKKPIFALLIVILFIGTSVYGLDYNGALKAARKENKPVLLYFFSKSCGYCTLMDKDTLADKDVAALLKKDFVFLRVDTDKSEDLAMLYGIRGTPWSWFLDSSGKRVRQAPGYISKAEYKVLLESVKKEQAH
jgi:thioredoxin-related protein